jgi:Subtilase family
MKFRPLTSAFVLLLVSLVTTPLMARRFILDCSPTDAPAIATAYGLTVVKQIPNHTTFLVTASDSVDPNQLIAQVSSDPKVTDFELDAVSNAPESVQQASLNQSTGAILDGVSTMTVVRYFQTDAPSNYVTQPATKLIRLADAQSTFAAYGAGVVAVIDTGVTDHPVLQGSLVSGYDVTRDTAGIPDEMADLDQSTGAILDQSTAAILDKNTVVSVNQSTAAILDQSTAAILDTGALPKAFGHGTMTAGIVHLVCPQCKIMPIKAFRGDGTAFLWEVIYSVYWATDHGAKIISMSFSIPSNSKELTAAINYANKNGVILVSSVGNNGSNTSVWPASYDNVLGVASTTNSDGQSSFTNFGNVVDLDAPGEGFITLYPPNNYAAAWGTSFSAPQVAGASGLLVQFLGAKLNESSASQNYLFPSATRINNVLGHGRIDVYQAVQMAK